MSLYEGGSYLFCSLWEPPHPHFSASQVLVNDCRSALPQMFTCMIWCTEICFFFQNKLLSFINVHVINWCLWPWETSHIVEWQPLNVVDHSYVCSWECIVHELCSQVVSEYQLVLCYLSQNVTHYRSLFHVPANFYSCHRAMWQIACMRVWWLCEGGTWEMSRNMENSWSNLNHLHNKYGNDASNQVLTWRILFCGMWCHVDL